MSFDQTKGGKPTDTTKGGYDQGRTGQNQQGGRTQDPLKKDDLIKDKDKSKFGGKDKF